MTNVRRRFYLLAPAVFVALFVAPVCGGEESCDDKYRAMISARTEYRATGDAKAAVDWNRAVSDYCEACSTDRAECVARLSD
jgi:hypothetical protein